MSQTYLFSPGDTVLYTPHRKEFGWAAGFRKIIRIQGDLYQLECGNIKLHAFAHELSKIEK